MEEEKSDSREKDVSQACSVCRLDYYDQGIFQELICNSCKVKVHKYCYQPNQRSSTNFLCDQCRFGTITACYLCDDQNGIKKHIQDNKFMHVLCGLTTKKIKVQSYGSLDFYFNTQECNVEVQNQCFYCLKPNEWACEHGEQCLMNLHPYCYLDLLSYIGKNKQIMQSGDILLNFLMKKIENQAKYIHIYQILNKLETQKKQLHCITQLYEQSHSFMQRQPIKSLSPYYFQSCNRITFQKDKIISQNNVLKMPEIMYSLIELQNLKNRTLKEQQESLEIIYKLNFNLSQNMKNEIFVFMNIQKTIIFIFRGQLKKYKNRVQKILQNVIFQRILDFQYSEHIIQILHYLCFKKIKKYNDKNDKQKYLSELSQEYRQRYKINTYRRHPYIEYDYFFIQLIDFIKKQQEKRLSFERLSAYLQMYWKQTNILSFKRLIDTSIDIVLLMRKDRLLQQMKHQLFQLKQSWIELLYYSSLDSIQMKKFLLNIYYTINFRSLLNINLIQRKKSLIKQLNTCQYLQQIFQTKFYNQLQRNSSSPKVISNLKTKILISNNLLIISNKINNNVKEQQIINYGFYAQVGQQKHIIGYEYRMMESLMVQFSERWLFLQDSIKKWDYLALKFNNIVEIIHQIAYLITFQVQLSKKQIQIYTIFVDNVIKTFQSHHRRNHESMKTTTMIKLVKIVDFFHLQGQDYKRQLLSYRTWKASFSKISNVNYLLQRRDSSSQIYDFICQKQKESQQFTIMDISFQLLVIKMIKSWSSLSLKLLVQSKPTLQSIKLIYKIMITIKYPQNRLKQWAHRQYLKSNKIQQTLSKLLSKCLLKKQFQPQQQLQYILTHHLQRHQVQELLKDLEESQLDTQIQKSQVLSLIGIYQSYLPSLSGLYDDKWPQRINLERIRKIVSYHPIIYQPLHLYEQHLKQLYSLKKQKKKVLPTMEIEYFDSKKINIQRVFSLAESEICKLRKNRKNYLPWKLNDLPDLNLPTQTLAIIHSWFAQIKKLQKQLQERQSDESSKWGIDEWKETRRMIRQIPIRSNILQKFQREIRLFLKWEKILKKSMKKQSFFRYKSKNTCRTLQKIKKSKFDSQIALEFEEKQIK